MNTSTTLHTRTAPVEIAVGAELGSYKLVSLLGEGAMGKVYRARHVRLGREVAIKILNPEYVARPDVVNRFFREARVVNEIDHEHIVEVTDFVEAPGIAYLVMELLDGTSLRQLLKQTRRKWPPLKRSLAIMGQVCDALEAAHQKGVVHRDLKPDNVFVVNRGGGDFVKVLDFGVAKLRDSDDGGSTVTGMILGTPLYMAPEQAVGKDVGRHADVWAAGVVLYELLSGAVPFKGETFVDLVTHIRNDPPSPLPPKTPRGDRIPPSLGAVVMKCLEKRPTERFRSMAALGEALRAPGQVPRANRSLRIAAVITAAALLAGGVIAATRLRVGDRIAAALTPASRSQHPVGSHPAAPGAERSAPLAPWVGVTPAPSRSAVAPAASPQPHAPAPAPSRAAPETSEPSHPRSIPTVDLQVRSIPAGATVVRVATGQRLGKTPLRLKLPRVTGAATFRLLLPGYEPAMVSIDLQKGGTASATLHRPHRRPGRHR